MTAATRLGNHAVVLGGSMAGLLAARAVADHYDRVTVLERDVLPDGPDARRGTPQARHIHVLLTAGRRAIEKLLPGFSAELIAAGALEYDPIADVEWISGFGPGIRFVSGLQMLGATRDLIEWTVRRRVRADPRIIFRQMNVTGLRLLAGRVIGVTLEDRSGTDSSPRELDADLVIDAGGRGTRTPDWLEQHGIARPAETVVNGFLGYATRMVRPPVDRPDWKAMYVQCAPPKRKRGGVIASVEGDRWIVSLVGGGKDYPPTDEAGFREFARSLDEPGFARFYEASEPLTPIVGTKTTENRFRHYEILAQMPAGLLVTGDAACAFNPVYGQGMSAAALGAETLARCLQGGLPNLGLRFHRELARSNQRPWLLATGEDYRYAEAEGASPGWMTRWTHAYLDRVIALAARVPSVRRKFMEVIHLIRSPASLFTPDLLFRAAFTRV